MAVARVTTNPRSYPSPSSVDEAFAFCDYLLAQPNCQVVEPGVQTAAMACRNLEDPRFREALCERANPPPLEALKHRLASAE